METGKLLSLIAGIIVIIATFMLTWFTVGAANAYGIGLIKNISTYFTDADSIATSWGIPTFAIYIVGGCYLLFLTSGLLLLIGMKSRVIAIIGAFMPIALCIAIIFGSMDIPPNLIDYVGVFLDTEPLLPGIIPFTLEIGPSNVATVALGTYILLAGGVLGFVSVFLERD
ncbi:MAG: hypothetical protein ACFE85_13710 [Candidatus Hodarchaeota archaeon]